MITKQQAINIAKDQMPSKGYKVDSARLHDGVWYIALSKGNSKFLVELDAKTGKIVGGAGGA